MRSAPHIFSSARPSFYVAEYNALMYGGTPITQVQRAVRCRVGQLAMEREAGCGPIHRPVAFAWLLSCASHDLVPCTPYVALPPWCHALAPAHACLPPQTSAVFNHPVPPSTFFSSAFATEFFRSKRCFRFDQEACLKPGDQYYEVTHNGLDVSTVVRVLTTGWRGRGGGEQGAGAGLLLQR